MEGIDSGIELSMLRIPKQDELHSQTPIEVTTGEKTAGSVESNSIFGVHCKALYTFSVDYC